MSDKTELHLVLLNALGALVEEYGISSPDIKNRQYTFSRCMLKLVEVLGQIQNQKTRNEILIRVSKLNEIALTNPEFDSAVSDALLKLSEEPTTDPSETIKRKISTIPPPRKPSDPPEENL